MKKQFLLLIGIIALFLSCKKELDLAIQDKECANFTLFDAIAQERFGACNGLTGTRQTNVFDVSFKYDGPDRCLNSLYRKVTFRDQNDAVVFSSFQDPDTVKVGSSDFSFSNGIASFSFAFDMGSVARYEQVAYATIDFQTQNENGDESNFLTSVIVMPCKSIPVSNITQQDYIVRSTSVQVALFDDAAEDGDIITIILNGVIIAENVTIFNNPIIFNVNIDPNIANTLTFYAVNEGSSSPNTVDGYINDGFSGIQDFPSVGLRQGETVSFRLIPQI